MPNREQKIIKYVLSQIREKHRKAVWDASDFYIDNSPESLENLSFNLDDELRCICDLWEISDEWMEE